MISSGVRRPSCRRRPCPSRDDLALPEREREGLARPRRLDHLARPSTSPGRTARSPCRRVAASLPVPVMRSALSSAGRSGCPWGRVTVGACPAVPAGERSAAGMGADGGERAAAGAATVVEVAGAAARVPDVRGRARRRGRRGAETASRRRPGPASPARGQERPGRELRRRGRREVADAGRRDGAAGRAERRRASPRSQPPAAPTAPPLT